MVLTVIGTSHVSKQSVKEVEEVIKEKKPDIVAVELDRQRLYALFHPHLQKQARPKKLWKQYGLKAFIFLTLARKVQKKLGESIRILPGSEMKKAVEVAATLQIKVALVDQDINITARKLNGVLGLGIFWRVVKDGVLGLLKRGDAYALLSGFNTQKPSEKNIKDALTYMKKAFPALYILLVEQRNSIMFSRVKKFLEDGKEVVLVVGAAHKEGIEKDYNEYKKNKVNE